MAIGIITTRVVDALNPDKKDIFLWDTGLPGFGVRVTTGGSKSYMGEPWRLHDIRRTVATGMQAPGIRTAIIEAVLNHKSGTLAGLVGVYQCYDFQKEKRAALELWGRHVEQLTKAVWWLK
ncbi:hypothetical protein [Sphingopyxis sp.]|uniref:hypothetical protein n=1 Tax=Sphingopyxis sp. TaxID=1908224 RepID=UPI002D76B523|nr:hypothetical protein [Sphingopyxis sp.]HET6526310.1 hypothetical protein [Sphingopyxis sp.]